MVNFQRMDRYDMDALLRVMELLRAPGGCPWDREQTHHSIRRNMLEEAYEAAEAIDEENFDHLKEELGDVLLQVVFHARMAEEAGRFNFADVVDGVAQKQVEKDQRTAGDTLDAVARSLPALMRAEKIQSKARKAGFDWDTVGPVLDKVAEETQELRQAVQNGTNVEEELGDLLFAAVKAGGFMGVDSELALHAACEKFIRRFRRVEQMADKPMTDMDIEALEALWRQAKAQDDQNA